ncbi:MAG TPA: aconitase family protein, partial [Rhizomicrobium sp.]|nr:aconitase family protein [Rhizomicrobium sp.]
MTTNPNSFKSRRTLSVGGKSYAYYSLVAAEKAGLKDISRLPYSMRVLLENLLRWEDGKTVKADDVKAVAAWAKTRKSDREIAFRPARVLMQDLTGVPAVVDLAAMRDAMKKLGGDPEKINPLAEVDLVIDHSVMVDNFGAKDSFKKNVAIEYERNMERYQFLRWGQQAFANFRVVPPGTGICHQVNLEYLAQTVWTRKVKEDIKAVVDWVKTRSSDREIAFRPARVLMQDLTGVPAVVDLAAMRDAMKNLGGDPERINPLAEVDLVIDH